MSSSSFDEESTLDGGLLLNDKRPDEDEDDVNDGRYTAENAVFSVLYGMNTIDANATPNVFSVLLGMILEWWQLSLLFLNYQYGWTGWISRYDRGWQVYAFVNMRMFMSYRGYTFFLVCLYILIGSMLVCAMLWGLIIYLNQIQRNDTNANMPRTLVKLYARYIFQVFNIAALLIITTPMNCQYFGVPKEVQFHLVEFPDVYCWSMPNVIHVALASCASIVFVIMAGLVIMSDIDLNTLTMNSGGIFNTKACTTCFAIKMLMVYCVTFVSQLNWLCSILTGLALIMTYLQVLWVPYYGTWVNCLKSASYMSITYISVCFMLLIWAPAQDTNDEAEMQTWRENITFAMWVGFAPAGCIGAVAAYGRLIYLTVKVPEKFKAADLDTPTKYIHKFSDARQVEIAARVARQWLGEDTHDNAVIKLGQDIIKAGVAQLPNDPNMMILYSSYLVEAQGSYQSGYSQLQRGKKMEPSFRERFAIYNREQEHSHKQLGARTFGFMAQDLVSYIEFMKSFRQAVRAHKDVLFATKVFWNYLMHHKVEISDLTKAVTNIEKAIKTADRVYKLVLSQHSASAKIHRLYSEYLNVVKGDPWASARLASEADRMDMENEASRNDQVVGGGITLGSIIGSGRMDDSIAVIVMNAHCIIQMTNNAASTMFGWKRDQLRLQNVNVLIPKPFSDSHNAYVAKYVSSGQPSRFLDRPTEFIALHHEGHVFPISITITTIHGVGEDSLFIGVIEALPSDPNVAKCWLLPSGSIVSTDRNFSNWFGYDSSELIGSDLSSAILNPSELTEAMQGAHFEEQSTRPAVPVRNNSECSVAAVQRLPSDTFSERVSECNYIRVSVRHKFMDPVLVDAEVNLGFIGSQPYYEMTFVRTAPLEASIVCDRKGRIVHVTTALAEMVGSSVDILQADQGARGMDVLIPEPFAQLHASWFSNLPSKSLGIPASSCRYGLLSQCLRTHTSLESLEELKPFKMQIAHRVSDTTHVITLRPRTWNEAYDERRLKLRINSKGIVTEVLSKNTEDACLYGFKPSCLLGLHVSSFIDVLRSSSSGEGMSQSSTAGLGLKAVGHHPAVAMLMHMARRNMIRGGSSWRVGVQNPIAETVEKLYTTHPATAQVAPMLQTSQVRTIPAVMTVGVERTDPSMEYIRHSFMRHHRRKHEFLAPPLGQAGKNAATGYNTPQMRPNSAAQPVPSHAPPSEGAADGGKDAAVVEDTERLSGEKERVVNRRQSGTQQEVLPEATRADEERNLPHAGDPQPVRTASTALYPSSLEPADESFSIIVELWRSDLLSCVLEVDGKGQVVGPIPEDPQQPLLCPPDLVFGEPMAHMIGGDVRQLLPLKVSSLQDLLKVNGKPAGIMQKGNRGTGAVGPVTPLVVAHGSDEKALKLTMQACQKIGSSAQMYLIFRVDNPSTGTPDLWDVLLKAPTAPAAQVGGTGATHAVTPSTPGTPGLRKSFKPRGRSKTRARGGNAGLAVELSSSLYSGGYAGDSQPRVQTIPDLLGGHKDMRQPPFQQPEKAAVLDLEILKAHGLNGGGFGDLAGKMSTPESQLPGVPPQINISPVDIGYESSSRWRASEGCLSGEGSEGAGREGVNFASSAGDVEDDIVSLPSESSLSLADEAGTPASDFKRGRRLRTLNKIMAGSKVTDVVNRFKVSMLLFLFTMLSVHLAVFIVLLFLVQSQYKAIEELDAVARASLAGAEISVDVLSLSIIYDEQELPGTLANGTSLSREEQVDKIQGSLGVLAEKLQLYHHRALKVLSGRRLPKDVGIRDLWEKSLLPVVWFRTRPESTQIDNGTSARVGLWELGNTYLSVSRSILATGAELFARQEAVNSTLPFAELAAPKFVVENGPSHVTEAYLISLDKMLEFTIQESATINMSHIFAIVLEGFLLTIVTIVCLWHLSQKVQRLRFNLYFIFIQIPMASIRQLATRPMEVAGGVDDDYNDVMLDLMDDAGLQDSTAKEVDTEHMSKSEKKQGAKDRADGDGRVDIEDIIEHDTSFRHRPSDIFGRGGDSSSRLVPPEEQPSTMMKLMGALSTTLNMDKKGRDSEEGTERKKKKKKKRVLIPSYRTSMWLISPFIQWFGLVVALNVTEYMLMSGIPSPIALLNVINFMLIRVQLVLFATLEYLAELDMSKKQDLKEVLASTLAVLKNEYQAMLYGGEAVEDDTPHFNLVKRGVASEPGSGQHILFTYDECMCENPADCIPQGDPLYPVTMNGLDTAITFFFDSVESILQADDAYLNSTSFYNIWAVARTDVEGGIVLLRDVYLNDLEDVYWLSETLAIVMMVLICALAAIFVLFIIRPYLKRTSMENRRIADLLSQVPLEVEVEPMLLEAIEDDRDDGSKQRTEGRLMWESSAMSMRNDPSDVNGKRLSSLRKSSDLDLKGSARNRAAL